MNHDEGRVAVVAKKVLLPITSRRDEYSHLHITLHKVGKEEVLRAVHGSQQTLHARRCRRILRLGEQDSLALNQEERVDLAVTKRRRRHGGESRDVKVKRIAPCEELLENGFVNACR